MSHCDLDIIIPLSLNTCTIEHRIEKLDLHRFPSGQRLDFLWLFVDFHQFPILHL